MKHYIVSICLRPATKKAEQPKKYLVTVYNSVDRKKHAVALALAVICGTERAPFMPFSWTSEKVRARKHDADLGRAWIEREEFEVRKMGDVKTKFIPRD